MSSSKHGMTWTVSYGNDGDLSTVFFTEREFGAWWRVDLSARYCVVEVKLVNINHEGL